MTREEGLFTAEVKERMNATLTPLQEEMIVGAYQAKPSMVLVQLEKCVIGNKPMAYFVAICARMKDDNRTAKPKAQPHGMDPVACRECGDSGFVILVRDVGEDALAGDAAPCVCALGLQKQARYGTIHYGIGDYEPTVSDPATHISLKTYAQSEAGLADPNLEAMRQVNRKLREMP